VTPDRERHDYAPTVLFLDADDLPNGSASGTITITTWSERPERRPIGIAPVVEVRYHGVPIAEGPIPAGELRHSLPFFGGALDPAEFTASAYVPPGSEAPAITTVVAVRPPELSHLERRALDHLPAELRKALALGCRDR
jgi:hypothetical protein